MEPVATIRKASIFASQRILTIKDDGWAIYLPNRKMSLPLPGWTPTHWDVNDPPKMMDYSYSEYSNQLPLIERSKGNLWICYNLDTEKRFLSIDADNAITWIAYDDPSKMAYLPAKFHQKYNLCPQDKKKDFLTKNGRMLKYNKMLERWPVLSGYIKMPIYYTFEVSNDVVAAYRSKVDSCMQGKDDLTDFYEEAGCSALIARSNDDGEIIGRAVLWHIDAATYCDRIYALDADIIENMQDYARSQGYILRKHNNAEPTKWEDDKRIKILAPRLDYIPWMDTFYQGYLDNGDLWMTNYSTGDGISLRDTSGTDATRPRIYCEGCGEYLDDDDYIIYVCGDPYCEDCTVTDNNGNGILNERAV